MLSNIDSPQKIRSIHKIMSRTIKNTKPRTPVYRKEGDKCTIPGAIPPEALAKFIVKGEETAADSIRSYVEWQAQDEKVRHLEKVLSENVFGEPMDAWDVRTNKGRWWVITNPTNLYSQRLFPSLDYTLSFHVGVMTRMQQAAMTKEQLKPHDRINELENKIARARSTLYAAKKGEDFQSVGMKCRECLLSLVEQFAEPCMVPVGQESPQRGNFIQWCELVAAHFAPGGSNERLRSHLREISKSTWHLVNWLTHAHHAGKLDGSIAISSTENVLESFIMAGARFAASKGKRRDKRQPSFSKPAPKS